MTALKTTSSYTLIPVSIFECLFINGLSYKDILNNINNKDIKNKNGSNKKSIYNLNKLEHFLFKEYGLSIKDFCVNILNIQWPKCPITGEDPLYKIVGKGVLVSRFGPNYYPTKENNENFKISCEEASKKRLGSGNPMFGKSAWNKGKNKETDERILKYSIKSKGKKNSEQAKVKMRLARSKSPLKARHTKPHSAETKELLRKNTARLWREGVFNQVSSIHIKVREFLKGLQLTETFQEEYQVVYFSMDFAFPNKKIAIECQGSYFHIDPRIYPNGPINAIQRRNYGRDKAKRTFTSKQGWKIIEIWEPEINDGSFKELLLCEFKKLDLLKN